MKFSWILLAVALCWSSATPNAAITQDSPNQKNTLMSDRERQGLRGLVKMCVEEETHFGLNGKNDNNIPQSLHTNEYDIEGRLVGTRWRNPDGSEWVTRRIYDASGHLQKTESGKEGEPKAETVYSYDDQGRLLKISANSGNPITFHYDEHGRKTKVQTSRPSDYRPNVASGGDPFEAADVPPNLPDGGTATTIYDEQDRPSEIQVRNLQGDLISHAVRIYDKQGRVTEEKEFVDNSEMLIPAEVRKEIKTSGESMDEFRAQLAKFVGGPQGMHSVAYTYDEQGRTTHLRRNIFNHERDDIETTYNDHGDSAGEITRSSSEDTEGEAIRRNQYSDTRYSYRYDTHGNWTERTTSFRNSPDQAFQTLSTTRRTLTYH